MKQPMFLCALGAVCLGVALQLSSGPFRPVALALTTLTAGVAVWAALLAQRKHRALPAGAVLGAGFLLGIYCHLFALPTPDADALRLQGFRGLALMTLVFGSAYLCLHLRGSLQRARFAAVLACFLAMGLAVLQLSPAPAAAPAPVDLRYLGLLALAGAGWAIGRLGGATGEVAALFLLFTGRSFAVIDEAWSDALVVAALAAAALLIARPPKRVPPWLVIGLTAGALAASRQPSALLVVPLALAIPRGQRLRAALVAVALLALGFLWWDPRGLAARFHAGGGEPRFAPGLEPLSLPLLPAGSLGAVLALVAAAAVLLLALRGTVTLARALSGGTAAWLVLVLLAPQTSGGDAFVGLGLLCVAIAAHARANETA